jgi:antitoxin component YwqK of YwqJK toxin-antitoxin module
MKLVNLFVIATCFLVFSCGEADLNDPKSVKKIVENALDWEKIQQRLNNDELLSYAPNSDAPYTGWLKKMHPNGQVLILFSFKDGLLDGQAVQWYDNGQKKSESSYTNGIRHGKFSTWYESGQKEAEVAYENGKKNGLETQWWDHGVKQMVLNWDNGVINGQFINWFSNGNKRVETNFKNGAPDGQSLRWHGEGQKLWDIKLNSGTVVSAQYYNKDGESVSSVANTGFSSLNDDEMRPSWVATSVIGESD